MLWKKLLYGKLDWLSCSCFLENFAPLKVGFTDHFAIRGNVLCVCVFFFLVQRTILRYCQVKADVLTILRLL